MKHQRIQNELSAYLDNELTPAKHKQVETHLSTCEECSALLSAFQQNRQRIAALVHPVPSTFKDAVMARIHAHVQNDLNDTCRTPKLAIHISAYLDDELAEPLRPQVEAHLHTCKACSDMLSVFRKNRERIRALEQPAPPMKAAVLEKIREQATKTGTAAPARAPWLPDFGRWLPDLGRWFLRPVTAGATGFLMLGIILGFLYLYPTASQYEETLDFYFGLHTEEFTDNPLKSNVGTLLSDTTAHTVETADDAELFLDLYLGD